MSFEKAIAFTKKQKAKTYRERNKEKLKHDQKLYREKTNYHKNWHLKNRYGIDINQYARMLEDQDGVCAICGKPETSVSNNKSTVRQLAVDHNHDTGVIRGLLCRSCNVAIGFLEEDKERIQNVLNYLDKYD